MEWGIVASIVAVLIAVASWLDKRSDAALPKAQHEEYKEGTRRELDMMLDRIKTLEQSRPTTGELEAKFESQGTDQRSWGLAWRL